MASVAITIPTALVPRVKDAMRATFPQHSELTDTAAFQEVTADYWRQIVRSHEASKAAETARATAAATATTDTAGIV